MDEKTTKMIKERFDALPKMIQEVILSSHYEETLIELGKKYQLNVDQTGMLEQETTLVMMGLTPTKDFEPELTRELHIDKLKGNQITEEINQRIFLKIRELLKIMNAPADEEPSLEEKEDTKNKNTNNEIMKSAGVEIVPEKLELKTTKEETHPILAQKLSGYTKNEVVKTEHTLENITKGTETPAKPTSSEETPKSGYTIDPYRMKPE